MFIYVPPSFKYFLVLFIFKFSTILTKNYKTANQNFEDPRPPTITEEFKTSLFLLYDVIV